MTVVRLSYDCRTAVVQRLYYDDYNDDYIDGKQNKVRTHSKRKTNTMSRIRNGICLYLPFDQNWQNSPLLEPLARMTIVGKHSQTNQKPDFSKIEKYAKKTIENTGVPPYFRKQ